MFRPWGKLDWALGLSTPKNWLLVGCLGSEQRSTVAPLAFQSRSLVSDYTLLRIEEPSESRFAADAARRLEERQQELDRAQLRAEIVRVDLLTPITEIDTVRPEPQESVVIDITSLPKRFFFYLLKYYFNSDQVRNLLVTYAPAAGYPSAPLTADHDPWDALPTFRHPNPDAEDAAHRRLVVNVGFMPEGLVAHLDSRAEERQIDLIIPFPAPITSMQRVLQSTWALRSTPYNARFHEHRVAPNDMSEAFDVFLSLLPGESNLVTFAPFGPKPISAAMCLYAAITGSPVYYAQPKAYRPDYSLGISTSGGENLVYAYWVKHDGRNLFCLPPERQNLDA